MPSVNTISIVGEVTRASGGGQESSSSMVFGDDSFKLLEHRSVELNLNESISLALSGTDVYSFMFIYASRSVMLQKTLSTGPVVTEDVEKYYLHYGQEFSAISLTAYADNTFVDIIVGSHEGTGGGGGGGGAFQSLLTTDDVHFNSVTVDEYFRAERTNPINGTDYILTDWNGVNVVRNSGSAVWGAASWNDVADAESQIYFMRGRGYVPGGALPVLDGDSLGEIQWRGWDGAGAGLGAIIHVEATEDWNAGAHGASWSLWTTAVGDVAPAQRLYTDDYGYPHVSDALYVEDSSDSAVFTLRTASSIAPGQASALYVGRSRGTLAAPTSVNLGDSLGDLSWMAYDGAGWSPGPTIHASTTQAHAPGAHGAKLEFSTVPNGAIADVVAMAIDQDGSVNLPLLTPTYRLMLDGSGNVTSYLPEYGRVRGDGTTTINGIGQQVAVTPMAGSGSFNTTILAGDSGAITAYADAGGGYVLVTAPGHTLVDNQWITIDGSINYNGIERVSSVIPGVSFRIIAPWAGNDGVGTWTRGASVQIDTAGLYKVEWSFQASTANVGDEIRLQIRGVAASNGRAVVAVAGKPETMSGFTTETLAANAQIYCTLRNMSSVNDIDFENCSLMVSRL